ncbi:hypothetical protein F0U61_29985 [Archangium violaceum]|uniref:alpha/beta fold hydrolase n=1 Tax=Archangium violaceum TaxID=83451 RepID=UPI002B2DFF06|nr:hypothetical protein F0U61_29985 [Archangium violaceum]
MATQVGASQESLKERTPRVDWAGLQDRFLVAYERAMAAMPRSDRRSTSVRRTGWYGFITSPEPLPLPYRCCCCPAERQFLHFFGMSIGGWTAINLAVRQPEKIASVSVFDPILTSNNLSVDAIVRSLPASARWFPKAWRDGLASWTANGAPVKDLPVAVMIEAGMQSYASKLSGPVRITEERVAPPFTSGRGLTLHAE